MEEQEERGEGMKIKYQCSNCGQKFQTSAMVGIGEGMYYCGCRAVGDAVYCEDCVKTWADRNGKPFDEQYKDPWGMFRKWWNNTVREHAERAGRLDELKVYHRTATGDYAEGGMV